jgi:hypothetical protein
MYDADSPTRGTIPDLPFTTQYPEFGRIVNRLVPHPLDKSSWFDPSLTRPPPNHFLPANDGTSVFEVNFTRQSPNDLFGGNSGGLCQAHNMLFFKEWWAPHYAATGGPYCYGYPGEWKNLDKVRELGEGNPSRSFSLFCGGKADGKSCWRYRGDVRVHKKVTISQKTFAKMGREEKSQWIDFFRFENVVKSFTEKGATTTPSQLFDSLAKRGSMGLKLYVLEVGGYNNDRIYTWLNKHRVKRGLGQLSARIKEDQDEVKEEIPSAPDSARRSRSSPSSLLSSCSTLLLTSFAPYRCWLISRTNPSYRRRETEDRGGGQTSSSDSQFWFVFPFSPLDPIND